MALAGSKDISKQRSEERSLCTFLVAAPYGLWITTCPVLTFPFPSASHGLSTSKALSWALCNCYGCQSSMTITFSWDWGAVLLVIMGHYVLADTYSAEIQQWFVKANSTNEVHCSVWNWRTTEGWDIITPRLFFSSSSRSSLVVSACSAETEKVCKLSSEENLQPFQDKMAEFLTQGETVLQIK